MDRTVQQHLQVVDTETLEDEYLAAGEEGSDDLEGGVLRGGADQDDSACLHGP